MDTRKAWPIVCASVLVLALVPGGSDARAALISTWAELSGPAEDPPNASPGTGIAKVDLDTVAHTLQVQITFSGLSGNTTAAHIHCCTGTPGGGNVGVATQVPSFVGFPLGVTAGSYGPILFDTTLASSWNPAFITNFGGGTIGGAEAALSAGISDGRAYVNVHTDLFPAGEIRGFLIPVAEPTTLSLLALGLLALGAKRMPRR